MSENVESPESEFFCTTCKSRYQTSFSDHVETDEHKYNSFVKLTQTSYKGNLHSKLGLDINVKCANACDKLLDYFEEQRRYLLHVPTDDLKDLGSMFQFKLVLDNKTKEIINISNPNVFSEDAALFDMVNTDWPNSGGRISINAESTYSSLNVALKIVDQIPGKYSIPFGFNVEVEGNTFLVVRTIVVSISDPVGHNIPVQNKTADPTNKPRSWNVTSVTKPVKKRGKFDNFPVPDEILEFLKKDDTGETEKSKKIRELMEKGLSLKNYAKYFHNCLWIEEADGSKSENLILERVPASITYHGSVVFYVPNKGDHKSSLVVGNLLRIKSHRKEEAFEGYIYCVGRYHVEIVGVNQRFLDTFWRSAERYVDVQLTIGRIPMERKHDAVNKVVERGHVACLFPDKLEINDINEITYDLNPEDFLNKKLANNPEQKKAIFNILNSTSQGAPYIVFGPPGTGKTDTIVEAICQILKNTKKKILVCAPANAHCDTLALKLAQYCEPKEMFRATTRSRETYLVPEELTKYANVNWNCKYHTNVKLKDLRNHRIVISTLIFIGKFNHPSFKPDFVFIDEAAQAMEPSVCVALARMRKGGSLILAGDPKQLKPVVHSETAKKFGLDTSLLQRLLETQTIYEKDDSRFIARLRTNYRCHPTILQIANELIYDSKLETSAVSNTSDPVSKINIFPYTKDAPVEESDLNSGDALEFCAVSSVERRENLSPSFFNMDEAVMVFRYLKSLLEIAIEPKISTSDIGIISPYAKQVFKIKEVLRKNNIDKVDVGTVESFQGREKRIILMSTVRGQFDPLKFDNMYRLGFLTQPERFNVAITRAVSKMVVIGCPMLLNKDTNWGQYIATCQRLNTYYGMKPVTRKTSELIEKFNKLTIIDMDSILKTISKLSIADDEKTCSNREQRVSISEYSDDKAPSEGNNSSPSSSFEIVSSPTALEVIISEKGNEHEEKSDSDGSFVMVTSDS